MYRWEPFRPTAVQNLVSSCIAGFQMQHVKIVRGREVNETKLFHVSSMHAGDQFSCDV